MLKLPSWFKDFALCFSLANLCYFRSWTAIQQVHGGSPDYFSHGRSGFEVELLTLVNVILLTGILRLLLSIVRESKSRVIRATAGLFLVSAFLTAGPQFMSVVMTDHQSILTSCFSRLTPAVLPFVIIPPLMFGIVLAIGWYRITVKAASAFAIFMFPRAIVNVFQVGWWVFSASPAYAYADKAPMAHAPLHRLSQPNRVVWIVFDEFDQQLAFVERPAGLQLDEFDHLRTESLYATAAHSPGANTKESLPSLIAGRVVEQTDPRGTSELMLRYQGETSYVPWSREPNVFRAAHQLGLRTALVGWYHPYCRVLGNDLDSCSWYSLRDLGPGYRWKMYTESLGLIGALTEQISRELRIADVLDDRVAGPGLSQEESSIARRDRLNVVLDARARTLSLATDSRYDLVFLHLPIPHPPAVYDRYSRSFTSEGKQSYADNLQATNDLLRDLRLAMESSEMWDTTTVVVSSDHPLRHLQNRSDFSEGDDRFADGKTLPYIPFLLKMPHQRTGITFTERFNTVHTAALLERVLRGEINTAGQTKTWMDAHSGN